VKFTKILIAYYSQTGNTERVAKAVHEVLAAEEVTLSKITEIDPLSLKSYNLVLLGSGIYAGSFHKSVKKLLKDAGELPPKFALFYTHATLEPRTFQSFPREIRKIIEKGGRQICAEFECLGNQNVPEEQIKQRLQNLTSEERGKAEEQIEKLKGHPDDEDCYKAQEFAQSLL